MRSLIEEFGGGLELIIATKQPNLEGQRPLLLTKPALRMKLFPSNSFLICEIPDKNILAIKQPLTIFSVKRKIAVNHPSKHTQGIRSWRNLSNHVVRIIHLVQNTPQKMTIEMKHQQWIDDIRVSYFWSVSLVRCSCRLRSLIDCSWQGWWHHVGGPKHKSFQEVGAVVEKLKSSKWHWQRRHGMDMPPPST